MKVVVFSSHSYDKAFLSEANQRYRFDFSFHSVGLSLETVKLAEGADAICVFVNDNLDRSVLQELKKVGVKMVALRCAGFNNVDIIAAKEIGIIVARVPSYSPRAVAEHAVALIMTLNRQTHKAYNRVRDGNFRLAGLLGFDVFGLTVGIVGTGQIGRCFADIMNGFGCRVLAHDPYPDESLLERVEYIEIEDLFSQSDIISLHCPLTPDTFHLIDALMISRMKSGAMLINTSRGALIETTAVIDGLKSGRIGYLGLDVYEEEEELFFEDLSGTVIHDDVFSRLLTFPNVLITGHQAFFTKTAMTNIAEITLQNLSSIDTVGDCVNFVNANYS